MIMEQMDTSESNVERRISTQACDVLNELRKTGQLCDAVLKVDGGKFPVHRAIMSACSPYFRALFTNGMHETDQREIRIPGVSAEMMSCIIQYAYTRDVVVTAKNVERLLPAADQFHVLGLVKLCCNFLTNQIDYSNCIGIRAFAKSYFCTILEKTANTFLMRHFTEVASRSTELLMLDVDDLCDILSSDELNCKSEEIIFETVLRWIDHDVSTRKKYILKLLQCIRLGLLTTQFFVEKVKVHPYVRDSEECRPLIIETLKFLYDLDMDDDKEVDLNNPLAKPRVPHEILFAVGGWSGGSPTNVIETYDTRADRWITCQTLDQGPRAYHGCATVNKEIYVIGGFDGMDYFNSVRCFHPETKVWREVAPMNAKRCYVSVSVLNDMIYAMGGFDGHVRQNTAERYNPKTNQWSMIAPMNQQRSDASATTAEGKVYICGGFNGQECMSSAEAYDPSTNQWTLIPPMRNRRSGVGIIAHQNCVYALGGFNGITRMNTGEKYCPQTNQWTAICEMYNPRSNFAIEVIDELVFAIGGFNGVTTIFNVECYDKNQDEWYDATDMNIYRSALSACVVSGLANVEDYIHSSRKESEKKRKAAALSASSGETNQQAQGMVPGPPAAEQI